MLAEDLVKAGNLTEALTELQNSIKKNPAHAGYRVFLFQLLSVLGQWDRALTQLNVAGDIDPETMLMNNVCGTLLQTEAMRADVFSGKRTPIVFGEPEEWISWLLHANQFTAEGHHDQAAELRAKAFEVAPAVNGTLNGAPFEWIADADTRIGPMIEAIIDGNYYWVPMHRVHQMSAQPPKDLRDLVWFPVNFIWTNGGTAVGFVPTRYPGSESAEDTGVRLARKTEWTEVAPDVYTGLGQRMLTTDVEDYPLLDVRHMELDNLDAEAAEALAASEGGEGTDG